MYGKSGLEPSLGADSQLLSFSYEIQPRGACVVMVTTTSRLGPLLSCFNSEVVTMNVCAPLGCDDFRVLTTNL